MWAVPGGLRPDGREIAVSPQEGRADAGAGELTPLSAEARTYYEEVFWPKYQRLRARAESTVLSVMILGPGEGDDLRYKKRVDIRNALVDRGHAAFFPEEDEALARDAPSLRLAEVLEAIAVDVVLILRASHGSVAELSDLGPHSRIAQRMLVFVEEGTEEAYSSRGVTRELDTLHGRVYWYRYPEDILSCDLLGRAVRYVTLVQYQRFVAALGGESEDP